MTKRLCLLLLFCLPLLALAQNGQEWINFNQQYYKIPVAEDGIYRITHADLVNAGVPVTGILPARYQLFHRGQEVAVRVSSVSNTPMQAGDFIEFYGQRNDGTLDQELFISPERQMHPYYNLFSDTTAYFLTWNSAGINGRRMAQSNLNSTAGLAAAPAYIDERLAVFGDTYSRGNAYGFFNETWLSAYDNGEGYTSTVIPNASQRDYVYSGFSNINAGAVQPALEIQVLGNNNLPHNVTVSVGAGTGSLRTVATSTFEDQEVRTLSAALTAADFSAAGEITIRVATDTRISVNYIRLEVPRTPQAEGNEQVLVLPEDPVDTTWLALSGASSGTLIYEVSDPVNVIRVNYSLAGTTANVILPGTADGARLLRVLPAALRSVSLEAVTFTQVDPTAFDYVILSHPSLRQAAGAYADPVQAYADYRSAAAGGGFSVLQMDMPDLYNQFSYGEYSSVAIYRLMAWLVEQGDPRYLLLIGKGVDHLYGTGGVNYRTDPTASSFQNLVPTGGYPGSDDVFTAGLSGSLAYEAAVPTGRINAFGAAQVAAYLDKVKEHEQRPFDDLRRKQILHLSGGLNPQELNQFRVFVDELAAFADDPYFGGQVTRISKRTNANVELINISDEVNEGLALITFFGHSGRDFSDIDVGFVTDPLLGYNNPGEYPMFVVNGCNAGNIFSADTTFGENWVLSPGLGAIAFIAHTGVGFPADLKLWSDMFYQTAFNNLTYIDLGVGDVQQRAEFQYDNIFNRAEIGIAQTQQTVLQGDPAVKLFGAGAPDYAVKDAGLSLASLDLQPVTALSDSFAIEFIIENFGRSTDERISVSVNHVLPDGQQQRYDSIFIDPVLYRDTLQFVVRPGQVSTFGVNRFELSIDYNENIPELNEVNNLAVLTAFLSLNGTNNLIPEKYALLDSLDVELIAQLSNLEGGSRVVRMQIDTVSDFSSGFRQSTDIESKDLIRWQPNLLTTDSTTYYWRSRLANPTGTDDADWVVSSFTYIAGAPRGWHAQHRQQWEQAELTNLIPPGLGTDWEFVERSAPLTVETFGGSHPKAGNRDISLILDEIQFISLSPDNRLCRTNTIAGMAIDRSSLQPYAADAPSGFDVLDAQTCGRTPQVINNYTVTEIENNLLRDYIDQVAQGDLVILFSIGTVDYNRLTTATLDRLEQVGGLASDFLAFNVGEPFILIGRKGDAPGTATFIRPDAGDGFPDAQDSVMIATTVTARADIGQVLTPLFGPALSWDDLSLGGQTISNDVLSYDVLGVREDFTDTVLLRDLSTGTRSIAGIDAGTYPYLRVNVTLEDERDLTPPDLNYVQAAFVPAPEGVLLRDDTLSQVRLQEGEAFAVPLRFVNVSGTNFADSVRVEYTFTNQETRQTSTASLRLEPLAAGADSSFTLGLDTRGWVGSNDLRVFANPREQREQSFNNNLRTLDSYALVEADLTNPILDVRIDGRTILDGEIVSPSPLISVLIRDENNLLLKEDTTGVTLFLKAPCEGCTFTPIYFSDPALSWTPASQQEDFEIRYQAQNLTDGLYTLRVQGTDASGNLSGTQPYQINFEVVTESGMTNFYPYPNPFSTSMRFVFTLTGNDLPDQLRIRIMTVTGRVVREIFLEELGPIRIGNNLTEFAWDGRDTFGDQLANGVYLYQVDARINGQPIELRSTAGDAGFKNGLGKIYLLR